MPEQIETPTAPPIAQPSSDDLGETRLVTEKMRVEIEKIRVETQDLKASRTRFIFTSLLAIITPLASVILFLFGWYGSHASERYRQNDELYARAAKELASSEAPERVSGAVALDYFMKPARKNSFLRFSEWFFTSSGSDALNEERKREAVALLIGTLWRESDAAVADAIENDLLDANEESVIPLISINQRAALLFSRTAGEYSGLSALRLRRAKFLSEDDWVTSIAGEENDPTITDILILVIRAGPAFERSGEVGTIFNARDFLIVHNCQFRHEFASQQASSIESDLSYSTRKGPPSDEEIESARAKVLIAAVTLERTGIILGKFASSRWDLLRNQNLFGTAVVGIELAPGVVDSLRSRGAFYGGLPSPYANPGCRFPVK